MLKNVHFGEISAEVELEKNPDLIKIGYYDYNNIIDKLLNQHYFIVLGNKGSGKSIIGEHIRLTAGIENTKNYRFVTNISLYQFPYKSLKKIISGSSETESKLPTTWKWLLLVYAFKSFNNDLSKSCEFDPEFNKAVDVLQSIGVLPADLNKIAILSSKKSFKLKLPLFEASTEDIGQGGELHYLHMIEYLERTIFKIQSQNQHYLLIDGLDEAISHRDIQYESIAALISEAREINKVMKENGVPFKVIIFCRKDIYKHLPGANKNKITNAFSIDLNWYQDHIPVENKEIVKLAIFRANVFGETGDVFKKYFPEKIDNKFPADYLLDNTRYTPRDFLQLLTYIGKNASSNEVTFTEIRTGIKEYSNNYFWPEIEDELDTYFSKDDVSMFKKLIVFFHKREFKLFDLITFRKNYIEYCNLDLRKLFEILYECGAVSNQYISNGNKRYLSRMKDDNDFNDQMNIVLHRGMWKALNLS